MKVAIFSDIHHGLALNDPIFHKINLDFYDWFLQQCVDNNVTEIWCLGDVFHNRKEINLPTLKNAHECFDKLKNFPVKMITGNHDAFYLENSTVHSLDLFKNWSNITVIDEETNFTYDGKVFKFIPWVGKQYQRVVEACDCALVHMEFVGFEMNGTTALHGTSPTIFEQCPLVISGHFHKFQDRQLKNTRIYYTGSPYEHNWGELENKYIHILDTDDLSLKEIENTVSPKHYYIHSEKDYDKITGNFVKILVDSDETEKAYKELFDTKNPLDVKFERKVKEEIQTAIITDFKNVDILPLINEFIDSLNEDLEIKEYVKAKNEEIYKKTVGC
jgi:DNA repair exonuclease SbcCD nuclease subunit